MIINVELFESFGFFKSLERQIVSSLPRAQTSGRATDIM